MLLSHIVQNGIRSYEYKGFTSPQVLGRLCQNLVEAMAALHLKDPKTRAPGSSHNDPIEQSFPLVILQLHFLKRLCGTVGKVCMVVVLVWTNTPYSPFDIVKSQESKNKRREHTVCSVSLSGLHHLTFCKLRPKPGSRQQGFVARNDFHNELPKRACYQLSTADSTTVQHEAPGNTKSQPERSLTLGSAMPK